MGHRSNGRTPMRSAANLKAPGEAVDRHRAVDMHQSATQAITVTTDRLTTHSSTFDPDESDDPRESSRKLIVQDSSHGEDGRDIVRTLHMGLRVANLESSLAFYTALGYEVLGEVAATEFGSLTMLKLPGDDFVSIELVHDPALSHVGPGGLHHFVINVDAVHDRVARLAGEGYTAEPPGSPDGSEDFWTAWLTDPDGYRIELVQWPPGHPEGMTHADLLGPGE